MSDVWQIIIGAGLQDGFNPCIFMTCAVFILLGFWGQKSSISLTLVRLLFSLSYMLGLIFFNYGPIWPFLLQKNFMLSGKIIYFALGTVSFIYGILFLKDWFLMRHAPQKESPTNIVKSPSGIIAISLITVILGVLLSLLSTVWPVNYYLTLLGTGALLKGQWQIVIRYLIGYSLISMWPLWFLWSFLSIKNIRPTLIKIVSASVFFLASSCIILIFK
ncbi:MAG: hypothetical protein HQL14_02350 [Candidatus Omnitrophica bacterium]|nr:hypothetical protein [Candidatus Omnitrophota bacterium]